MKNNLKLIVAMIGCVISTASFGTTLVTFEDAMQRGLISYKITTETMANRSMDLELNNNSNNPAWATGSGIIGINFASTVRNIEVYDNIVKDFHYSGIIMSGPTVNYQVHDNTIEGNGSSDFYQNGIEIYAGNGAVKNNTISNISEYTTDAFAEGAGIVVAGTYEATTEISGNRIEKAEAGIILGNGTQLVKNNEINGSIVFGIEGFNYGGKNANFTIENNIIYQDNMSTLSLEKSTCSWSF